MEFPKILKFPATHIELPKAPHTHTVILLHGRGSDGKEFAEEFFTSRTSNGKDLLACLPSYRWVFPTSCNRYSTTFKEDICSWFDAYSLSDISEKEELQKEGLTQSVCHILQIIEEESDLLERNLSHLYLGGISQGMATALWTFLAAVGLGRIQLPLGGLLGFCGWLPFAQKLEGLLCDATIDIICTPATQRIGSGFFFEHVSSQRLKQTNQTFDGSAFSTPVLLGHGMDDAWVSVDRGRQASFIIRRLMPNVESYEFSGAEAEGHWIKEPEGFDHILQFLQK